ncbi:NUDIX hydrolase [Virgibacillus litoralis]|uniref:8-oxo-dGTP pyrophosphatase MutT (NUDIX family) n=1 Tax=Virgibacillus litoralis TaxID=578221 RepID=A0ABS4HGY1_9BACI|nr:CoA pyrophosphatase [Virgibacillus litoralis]MBP1949969.1 8-oxo-dGTP pyrophosphatase MutT (NUDIX family) [Virgibacillus litoralis]
MDTNAIFTRVKEHTPKILGSESFSKFAVLIPLVEKDDEINILFEVRSHSLKRQPGEICFPGGRLEDQDQTEQDAAIRETTEELGINRADISEVHPLDYLVSPFGMIVYPYAGFIGRTDHIEPNPSEVEEVFMVPLKFFVETEPEIHRVNMGIEPEENFPYELIVGGRNYSWRSGKIDEYFYTYDNKVIWGLTARIISHFTEIIQDE